MLLLNQKPRNYYCNVAIMMRLRQWIFTKTFLLKPNKHLLKIPFNLGETKTKKETLIFSPVTAAKAPNPLTNVSTKAIPRYPAAEYKEAYP